MKHGRARSTKASAPAIARSRNESAAAPRLARYGCAITTARHALFLLLPHERDLDELLAGMRPELGDRVARLALRRYPRASNRAHLLSLVRDGRDAIATRWIRGTVLAIVAGAMLGTATMGVLTHYFLALGGLLDVALSFGFAVGAFLGGFTAAMTGTQVARDEVRRLADEVRPGDTLLQWSGDDREALAALAALAAAHSLSHALIGN